MLTLNVWYTLTTMVDTWKYRPIFTHCPGKPNSEETRSTTKIPSIATENPHVSPVVTHCDGKRQQSLNLQGDTSLDAPPGSKQTPGWLQQQRPHQQQARPSGNPSQEGSEGSLYKMLCGWKLLPKDRPKRDAKWKRMKGNEGRWKKVKGINFSPAQLQPTAGRN